MFCARLCLLCGSSFGVLLFMRSDALYLMAIQKDLCHNMFTNVVL